MTTSSSERRPLAHAGSIDRPSRSTRRSDLSTAAQRSAQSWTDHLTARQVAKRFPGFVDAVRGGPLCRIDGHDDGLCTVAFRQRQLPERYLRGLLGFRLSQFLQAGLMDPQLVWQRAITHEPVGDCPGQDTVHVVTLRTGGLDAGQIVGCVALVGSADAEPRSLTWPHRRRFPAEVAHDVDLLAPFAAQGWTTHQAYEIKRFVREVAMERGAQRSRVPWHLILGVGWTVRALGDGIQILLGDSGEWGALRHLRALGLDLLTIEGTTPSLPRTELMWRSYLLPEERRAKPFVAPIPADNAAICDAIEAGLRVQGTGWTQSMLARLFAVHQARTESAPRSGVEVGAA
jgi:hypothetical protein